MGVRTVLTEVIEDGHESKNSAYRGDRGWSWE